MCLQAMTIVYGRCYEEIGAFNDTKYIVGMLERVRVLHVCYQYMELSSPTQLHECVTDLWEQIT